MQKGTIGVTTENIFPVIKKFLYSDHEIFLRELVSNAVDASQKLKTLSSFGEYKGELGEMRVEVSIDKEAKTLTVSDRGIGMTAEDIDKYINQIAFSGAEEFLNKYKDNANAIIGHFGLGFYSAFMVSTKVEIRSLSYKEGAEPIMWTCDGSPEYEMGPCDKTTRGTDIVLYLDDDSKEFLESARVETLLRKYCRFLPVPVVFGKEQEWKDGKMVDTDRDRIINNTEPQWTKKPSELTDKDYLEFYHELYPGQEDPLFWIHLNVDYPFTLTGILFFPRIKNNIEVQKNRIQLYCNSVFVTDSVEGVVPEFMMLMQGVIDSPDIPLNVSRSYLQSDTAVKKISGYITRKVAQRLEDIFKNNRQEFEQKWNDIKIFIEYGMLTDEKFCESAMKFILLKDTKGDYYSLENYRNLVEAQQTDKDSNVIYLYATDTEAQYPYIKAAEVKGYDVLVMDGQLDSHFIGLLESKIKNTRFVRVDSDVVDRLIVKNEVGNVDLDNAQRTILTGLFQDLLPKMDNASFIVSFESMTSDAAPVTITTNEYMRRMKEMATLQPGMSFYSELPDSYNLVVNVNNPIVNKVATAAYDALQGQLNPVLKQIDDDNKILGELQKDKDNKDAEKDQKIKDLEKKIADQREIQNKTIADYASNADTAKQLVDLALLRNNLLRGAELNRFIDRSLTLL